MQHIRDVKERLKVGQWIRTNGIGPFKIKSFGFNEGMVGEISDSFVYIWQNEQDGSVGSLKPETKGYKYSWRINKEGNYEIEILREPNEFQAGDKVKMFKKSTADCGGKKNGYNCCEDVIGEIGTVRYISERRKTITVKDFPNGGVICTGFSPDCLSLMERGDKNEATKEQLKQVIKLVDNQKGEVEMKEIVRKVYTKDSLETAELVDREMSDIDLGQGFMSVLALTEKKDIVLKEAKRRKKEREDKESK